MPSSPPSMRCARPASHARAPGVLSPIQQAEREDAIADWLAGSRRRRRDCRTAGRNRRDARRARSDCRSRSSGPPLGAVLRWAAAGCSVRGIASEIQEAAMRISGLVTAIKGFTHMDQATVAEPVDLTPSLGNTVAVLKVKGAVEIGRGHRQRRTRTCPRVRGFAGELNQIWANLIDNALDAVPDSGRVEVTANRERHRVVVRVVDNGPGIPGRDPRAPVRTVLHDQAGRQRHRPGPRHRPAPRQPQRRRDRGRDGAGANRVSRLASARRRRAGPEDVREQAGAPGR